MSENKELLFFAPSDCQFCLEYSNGLYNKLNGVWPGHSWARNGIVDNFEFDPTVFCNISAIELNFAVQDTTFITSMRLQIFRKDEFSKFYQDAQATFAGKFLHGTTLSVSDTGKLFATKV